MSTIKNKLITMVPRKMRVFIREIIFRDITEHEDYTYINLELKKFYTFNLKEKLEVTLSNSDSVENLEYILDKNVLSIKLNGEILSKVQGNSSISITVDGKHMIINEDENIQKKTSFFSEKKYFNILTDGTIILEHLFADYHFNEEYIEAESMITSYERLGFNFNENTSLSNYDLALLYPNKIVSLSNAGHDSEISAVNFESVTMGRASIYLIKDFVLTPVKLLADDKKLTTKEHKLTFLNDNDELLTHIENHELEMKKVECELVDNHVLIRLSYDAEIGVNEFIVVDTVSDAEKTLSVNRVSSSEFTVRVSVDTLVNEFSRKKFKLITNGAEPLVVQPNFNNLWLFGFGERLVLNYNHENIKLWFYKRKDSALGFKVTRPRIKREVTSIDGFNFEGYIKGQENFVDCKPHMIFEDRYSREYTSVIIDSTFNIDLNTVNLRGVKSKDKSILDVFIAMIHESGEIVRKEKIKYKLSDYKKDNYYGSHSEPDNDGNTHYHLITTTPFDNLKIESFAIPEIVPIPDDTSVKDYNMWLVGERYDTAQDNGYAFFKYLKAETSVEAYYVIESSAPDYEKIKSESNVLIFGSVEHFIVAFKAGVLLGTHDLENLLPYKPARGFFNYEDTIKVFLQHGVLGRKRVEYHKKYYDLPFDLFIVSSEPEKYAVVMKKLGYDEDEVAVTGLARFDSLPRNNKTHDILLMPTWRDWIHTDEAFLTSQYFHNYNGLIHNERLIKILEDNDVQLNFYPHYRAQMYFNDEILNPSKNINFIQLGSRTVQELLIEHSLLITDYSSVSFDFTLMDKPVIYYHFDVRKFFRQGKLRPLFHTFIGDIARTEDDLIDLIELQIKKNFKTDNLDISGIFEYQDHHNSERIYKSVIEKIES